MGVSEFSVAGSALSLRLETSERLLAGVESADAELVVEDEDAGGTVKPTCCFPTKREKTEGSRTHITHTHTA